MLQHKPIEVVDYDDEYVIGFETHKALDMVYEVVILNSRNVFVQWLLRVVSACSDGRYDLRREQAERLTALFDEAARYPGTYVNPLNVYVAGWRAISDLPPEFYPPALVIDRNMFTRRRPDVDRSGHAVPTE